jgi:hypothetical protein
MKRTKLQNVVVILGVILFSVRGQASESSSSSADFPAGPVSQSVTAVSSLDTSMAPPVISAQPASLLVNAGTAATIAVTATGGGTLSYQWLRNGMPISGATTASYSIASVAAADAGAYSVRVSNSGGHTDSSSAALSVNVVAGTLSAITASQTVNAGTDLTLSATTAGTGLTYKWRLNGRLLTGQTASSLALSNLGTTMDGTYTVTVSNASGVAAVGVTAVGVHVDARLTNLSARGHVGLDDEVLILGFVIGGTGNKNILMRAVGPTLSTSFGLTTALMTPKLSLHGKSDGVTITDSNSVWGGGTTLSNAFAAVGAFPLPVASKDAALLESLSSGIYTGSVSGLNGSTGIALAELYDADTGAPTAKLTNISARAAVGAEVADMLVAGFVVTGTTSETVLIRGVGPSLGTLFGMRKAIGSSQVTLYDAQGNQIAANASWGSRGSNDDTEDPDTETNMEDASDRVGAFRVPRGSKDSGLLVTLKPGLYTAHVTGRNKDKGIALVEVYEVR